MKARLKVAVGRRHDAIVVNLMTAIHFRTMHGPCQVFAPNAFVNAFGLAHMPLFEPIDAERIAA